MRRLTPTMCCLVFLAAASTAEATLRFHFDDRFDADERRKLTLWISEVAAGVERLVGPFPFEVGIHFRRTDSRQPVPWARTLRGRSQGIRFHVNPDLPLADFRRDWTAPHELSHLILPYLGRQDAWFAEGFASFMQYQVMHAMGILDEATVERRYRERLDMAASNYGHPGRPFVEAAPRLRAERKYPVIYWGGAVYFFRLDRRLATAGDDGLLSLLTEYLRCCRRDSDELGELIEEFDDILERPHASEEMRRFIAAEGFPRYQELAIGVIRSRDIDRDRRQRP